MRIFLTGVGGYLGGVLAGRLAGMPEVEGVTGIDVSRPKDLPSGVEFLEMDVRSPEVVEAMAGHEVVVHTAFVVAWPASMPEAVRDDINLNGARNVARAAAESGVRRFVHASSNSAYDPEAVSSGKGITEDFPRGRGDSPFYYANGKAVSERIVQEVLDGSGTTLTRLRPTFIIGPQNKVTVENYRRNAAKFRGRNPRMQFVHEDDVAEAFAMAVREDLPGAYNLAPDDYTLWEDFLAVIGAEDVPEVPVWLARTTMTLRWRFLGAPTHPSWLSATLGSSVVSNAKMKATGWEPRYDSKGALKTAL